MVPMLCTECSLSNDERTYLLQVARCAIARQLGLDQAALGPAPDSLQQTAACFVTLTQGGELRGCIGTLEANLPLVEAVAHYAQAAAANDPRFPPLNGNEFSRTRIEVSVLSKPVPLNADSDRVLLAQLQPGVHGLTIERGRHRATFLPQVWEQLPTPEAFLSHLKRKAGLSDRDDAATLRCSVYTVICFHEDD